MNKFGGPAFELAAGIEWVRDSLEWGAGMNTGGSLEPLVLKKLELFSEATLLAPLVPAVTPVTELNAWGREFPSAEGRSIEALAMTYLRDHGVRSIVVEDEMASRGDSDLEEGGSLCFVNDRVLRWAALEEVSSEVTRFLQRHTTGYPTNVYFCRLDGAALGLENGKTLNPADQQRVVDAICAIVVSVYDGDAFFMLSTDSLRPLGDL
ncbi:hypothetical protein [Psychromicrobium lacuslunae]|uniref:Uncharacterized protein n=1 Tax=Psychromicrobium lacuslunae TaxID=1618207 RepID=A0A0D4BWQ9_9MICC|nr:hypothetical protein [Psychromicrobium lacuslunae]AJT40902.1 hypothetical protein UM93_04140 [Psychromicrobium lacuslunae]